jgi:DNA-binding IscR family transcriptional regulator
VRVFQKDFRLNECNFKKKPCPRKGRCPLRRKIEEIEQGVLMRLQKTKVGSLLKEARDA